MNKFISLLLILSINKSFAWDVQCGEKSLYYSNGSNLVTSTGSVYYKSGGAMITSNGSIYSQTGATIKTSSGSIYYSSGATLKTSTGSFYYENGSVARTSSGILYKKDGNQTSLPFLIPIQIGDGVVAKIYVSSLNGDSNIELEINTGISETINIDVSDQGIFCHGLVTTQKFKVIGAAGSAIIELKPGKDAKSIQDKIQKILDNN